MTATTALLCFALWTLLLVTSVFAYRGIRVLGGVAINSWPRGNKAAADPAVIKRIEDAHANALENLPIFAILVLVAAATGKLALIEPFAAYVFYARVGQSAAHLLGTSVPLVLLRATFWAAQLALFFFMFTRLLA